MNVSSSHAPVASPPAPVVIQPFPKVPGSGLSPTAPRVPPKYAVTPEQLEQRLRDLAARYPNLVEVKDVGDSLLKHEADGKPGAGHDILALVLTDKAKAGPKPRLAHLGAVHGTEMAAPTLLLEFAEQLLAGYGRDPQATMLLQEREIHVMPMVNPDGIEGMFRRWKGETDVVPGRQNAKHVNLNRNFPYGWGGLGSSAEPRSDDYRGPAPASEPETQAVIRYMEANKPDLFVDWHNSGRLALYPWGETNAPGTTVDVDRDVAIRVASRNGYTAKAGAGLYPTSGTSVDWAHGALGVPALTIETGSLDYLTDRGYEKIRNQNMAVLWDLAAIADRPGSASVGPDTWVAGVKRGVLTARIAQDRPDRQAIRGAELLFDPKAAPGTGIPLQPVDGAFDSPTEAASIPVPADAPSDGLAYVRSVDANGNWGALRALWLTMPQLPAPDSQPNA